MSGFEALIAADIIRSLAWALVHFVWQGTIIALLVAAVLSLLAGRGANARYATAVVGLTMMLCLPVLSMTFMSARANTPIASTSGGGMRASTSATPTASWSSRGGRSAVPAPGDGWISGLTIPEPVLARVVSLWLAGVALFGMYHLAGLIRTATLARAGVPVAPDWQHAADRLRHRLGIARPVQLLESATYVVPAVVGWLRPVILMPASALTGMSAAQLEAILAHELAHVRRHDYLVNLLQAVAETLLYYHPGVWWVSHQVRVEREHCCDDITVALGCDPLTLVRALADLETQRGAAPQLAVAATGGPLLRRVRRLLGHTEPRPTSGTQVAAVVTAAVLVSLPAVVRLDAAPLSSVRPGLSSSPSSTTAQGRWTAELRGDELDLDLRRTTSEQNRRWHSQLRVLLAELSGLRAGATAFELRREAGTLYFDGDVGAIVDGAIGSGSFRFAADSGYRDAMAALGYRVRDDEQFALMIHDVDLAFIDALRDLGYDRLSLDDIFAFRIHGATPEFIRELRRLGHDGLAADDLLAFRIHGVGPESIRELAAIGYRDVPADELVAMAIHGVDRMYIDRLATLGHTGLDIDQLTAFRIHGVSPEFIDQMRERGYRALPASALLAFRIHGVSPEFIDELTALGYRDIGPSDLVSMRIHGVTPSYIRDKQRDSTKRPSVDRLIAMRIHGDD